MAEGAARALQVLEQRERHASAVRRLQTHADRTHQLLLRSRHLLHPRPVPSDHPVLAAGTGGTGPPGPADSEAHAHEGREAIAKRRLLEWEAEDLAEVVPGEMGTPRRRFAMALYELVAVAESMGMSEERLRYHLHAAQERYRRGD